MAANKTNLTKTGKLVFYSSLGGMLEFYDFIIYALLATYIANTFFSFSGNLVGLLETFATFSIGYLVRPIGGIVFGHFGDKYGRKKVFMITIMIMAISTFLMGCIPSYQSIGMAAPIILIILRLLQGFSVGGEIPGAITYISEVSSNREGLCTGIIFTGLIYGIVLGSLVITIMYLILSHEQVSAWGWRIAFILGGLLGWVSYILRKRFYESPLFSEVKERLHSVPLVAVLKYKLPSLFAATFFVANAATISVLLFLFLPAYLSKILQFPVERATNLNTLFLFISASLVSLFGFIADKVNKKLFIFFVAFASLIFAAPIFYFYSHMQILILPIIISALLQSAVWGITPSMLAEIFPTEIRYTGIGMAYNFAFAIFGGLTPLIATLLIQKTHNLMSPSYLLIFSSILALIGVIIINSTYEKRC